MSLDLAWNELDSTLATRLVDALNRQLSNVERPSFIGPVQITGFEFGTICPDVEVVDMRDIYRDFLEDDEEDEEEEDMDKKVTERGGQAGGATEDDEFEWVSRRSVRHAMAQEAPMYHHLPPHMRYGRAPGPSSDYLASLPGLHSPRDIWNGGMSLPNLAEVYPRPPLTPLQGMAASFYTPRMSNVQTSSHTDTPYNLPTPHPPPEDSPLVDSDSDDDNDQELQLPPQNLNKHPDVQLHLRVLYHSDLRLSLTTSLLINYPSPMFMSLPIKLSVVGLVFDGEVVVAYEGSRRRVHFCILDDLDPYGPAGDRPKRDSTSTTPSEPEDSASARPSKPLPVGQRLLPSIFIESEIGQADKHVLKNVGRVERFIQDVIRKTVEDELVFPNFHTLILGD